jgi:anti-anti-sigma regulatory factor
MPGGQYMSNQGLQLEVRRFCGAPMITAKGRIDGLHTGTLTRLLQSFKFRGHDNMILDFNAVDLVENDGKEALMSVMQGWHPEMKVHIVAQGELAEVLGTGALPFTAHLCSSPEAAAEQICRSRRTLTLVAPATDAAWQDDIDLPMAA